MGRFDDKSFKIVLRTDIKDSLFDTGNTLDIRKRTSITFNGLSMDKAPMLIPELSYNKEFDFDSIIGDNSYSTISGIHVDIDRIIRDITKTTVIAISGTMIIRGVKIRGVWDIFGNIIKCKSLFSLFAPRGMFVNIYNLFDGITEDLLQLVNVTESTTGTCTPDK